MNKDEMSDDAEFEAFLKGEGELSRRLQGVPQPSPGAALDAAILGRIRTSMEQQQRDAANDPGEAAAAPQLARGLGMRWRVPAGIAATVLVGLFATQAYRSGPSRDLITDQERGADAVVADEPVVPVVPVAPVAPALEQAAPPELAVQARASAKPEAKPVAPVVKGRAPPAPPPPPEAYVSAEKQKEWAEAAKAAAERRSAEYYMAPSAPAPMPAPVVDAPVPTAPSPMPAHGAADVQDVTVTGSRIRVADAMTKAPTRPAAWLEKIDRLLRDGDSAGALLEWEKFRAEYPRHAAPPELEEKIKALAK